MSYIPCASNEKIWITDGFLAPIVGKGLIFHFEGLTLHIMLHVSRMFFNLLSRRKLTRELNYKVIFLPDSVSF